MDFSAIFQTWVKVLTNPGEQTFEAEKESPDATLTTAIIWVVIAAAIAAVLGFLRSLIFAGSAMTGMQQFMNMADLPPDAAQQIESLATGGAMTALSGVGSFASIILTPIFFLIGVGIFHLVAKVLGGQGEFEKYAYLTAAFQAPMTIINALLAFVPVVGGCVGLLVSIYSIVLAYFATKVNYNLTSGKALIVVLLPLILFLLLAACGIFFIAGAVISGMNG